MDPGLWTRDFEKGGGKWFCRGHCGSWWLLQPAVWAASFAPMLPEVDDGAQAVAGWLMSEKLDGVRGY